MQDVIGVMIDETEYSLREIKEFINIAFELSTLPEWSYPTEVPGLATKAHDLLGLVRLKSLEAEWQTQTLKK